MMDLLNVLRIKHERLFEMLKEPISKFSESNGDINTETGSRETLHEIEKFISEIKSAGDMLFDPSDRSAALAIQSFWIQQLHRFHFFESSFTPLPGLNPFRFISCQEFDGSPPFPRLRIFRQEFESTEQSITLWDRLAGDALGLLENRRIIGITGAAGSGRSHFIKHGLLREADHHRFFHSYRIVEVSPVDLYPGRDSPSRELSDLHFLDSLISVQGGKSLISASDLREQPSLLAKAISGEAFPILLVVHDLDELFLRGSNPLAGELSQEQSAFLEALVSLCDCEVHQHLVVVDIRNDAFGRLARCERLWNLLSGHDETDRASPGKPVTGWLQLEIKPGEIFNFIQNSCKSRQIPIDPGLSERLVAEHTGEPATIPILLFTLNRLWTDLEDVCCNNADAKIILSWEGYHRVRGGRTALQVAADSAVAALREAGLIAEVDNLKPLFWQFVHLQPGSFCSLDSPSFAELSSTFERLKKAEAWSEERLQEILAVLVRFHVLLKEPANQAENPNDCTYAISHPALLECWYPLQGWLDEWRVEQHFRWLLRRDLASLKEAREAKRTPFIPRPLIGVSYLWRGSKLREAQKYSDLTREEAAFVKTSERAQSAVRRSVAATFCVILSSLAFGFWAISSKTLELYRERATVRLQERGLSAALPWLAAEERRVFPSLQSSPSGASFALQTTFDQFPQLESYLHIKGSGSGLSSSELSKDGKFLLLGYRANREFKDRNAAKGSVRLAAYLTQGTPKIMELSIGKGPWDTVLVQFVREDDDYLDCIAVCSNESAVSSGGKSWIGYWRIPISGFEQPEPKSVEPTCASSISLPVHHFLAYVDPSSKSIVRVYVISRNTERDDLSEIIFHHLDSAGDVTVHLPDAESDPLLAVSKESSSGRIIIDHDKNGRFVVLRSTEPLPQKGNTPKTEMVNGSTADRDVTLSRRFVCELFYRDSAGRLIQVSPDRTDTTVRERSGGEGIPDNPDGWKLPGHPTILKFSDDGSKLAVVSGGDKSEAQIDLLSLTNRDDLNFSFRRNTFSHPESITSICFNPTGDHFAFTCQNGEVQIFETGSAPVSESEAPVQTEGRSGSPPPKPSIFRETGWTWSSAWSPCGRFLATGNRDRYVRVYDVKTGSMYFPPLHHAETISSIYFSPDSLSFFTTTPSTVRRWSALPRYQPDSLIALHDSTIFSGLSEDGSTLSVLVKSENPTDAGRVISHLRTVDLTTGKALPPPELPDIEPISGPILAESGNLIAFTYFSRDEKAEKTPKMLLFSKHPDLSGQVSISSLKEVFSVHQIYETDKDSNEFVLVGSYTSDNEEPGILIFRSNIENSPEGMTLFSTIETRRYHGQKLLASAFDRSFGLLAIACQAQEVQGQSEIKIVDVQSFRDFQIDSSHPNARHREEVNCLAFSEDGMNLVSGCSDDSVRVFRRRRKAPDYAFRAIGDHTANVSKVAFTDSGRSVISGAMDNSTVIWKVPAFGNVLEQSLNLDNPGPVTLLNLSSDGRMLAIGGGNEVSIWKVPQYSPVLSIATGTASLIYRRQTRLPLNAVSFGKTPNLSLQMLGVSPRDSIAGFTGSEIETVAIRNLSEGASDFSAEASLLSCGEVTGFYASRPFSLKTFKPDQLSRVFSKRNASPEYRSATSIERAFRDAARIGDYSAAGFHLERLRKAHESNPDELFEDRNLAFGALQMALTLRDWKTVQEVLGYKDIDGITDPVRSMFLNRDELLSFAKVQYARFLNEEKDLDKRRDLLEQAMEVLNLRLQELNRDSKADSATTSDKVSIHMRLAEASVVGGNFPEAEEYLEAAQTLVVSDGMSLSDAQLFGSILQRKGLVRRKTGRGGSTEALQFLRHPKFSQFLEEKDEEEADKFLGRYLWALAIELLDHPGPENEESLEQLVSESKIYAGLNTRALFESLVFGNSIDRLEEAKNKVDLAIEQFEDSGRGIADYTGPYKGRPIDWAVKAFILLKIEHARNGTPGGDKSIGISEAEKLVDACRETLRNPYAFNEFRATWNKLDLECVLDACDRLLGTL